jgi:membrane-associated phospholipid phosphatase
MRCKTFLASLAAVSIAAVVCDRYLDIPLAQAVHRLFHSSRLWGRWTADIPDLLFLSVSIITAISACLYLYRLHRRLLTRLTWLCQHIACTVPVAYLLKTCGKLVFGRVNTRYWLTHPEAYRFNWFHGSSSFSGFPSGHMAVFAALAAGVWRFYPRYRVLTLLGSLLLAGALIATNYHVLGDVIAGAYLGICIEAFTSRLLDRRHAT